MSYKFHVAQTCAYIMQACVGLPTSPAEPPDLSGVPPETVPSGDFKVSSNPTSQPISAPQKPWLYGALARLSSMARVTAGRPGHKAHAAAVPELPPHCRSCVYCPWLSEDWFRRRLPQVPYCEGVEIVSAAETAPMTAPMTAMKEGLDLGSEALHFFHECLMNMSSTGDIMVAPARFSPPAWR